MSVAREQPRSRQVNGPLIGGAVALLAALGLGGWALTHNRTERASRQPAAATGTTTGTGADAAQVSVTPSTTDNSAAAATRAQAETALTAAKADRDAALQPYLQQLEAARAAFKDAQSGRKQAL